MNAAARPPNPTRLPTNIMAAASRCPVAERGESRQAGRPLELNRAMAERIIQILDMFLCLTIEFSNQLDHPARPHRANNPARKTFQGTMAPIIKITMIRM